MQRLPMLALAGMFALFGTGVHAGEDVPPGMPDISADTPRVGRYTMVPADGGFVRLDTETGTVSHCRRESAAIDAPWRCAAIPEAVLGEPGRIEALATRVDALSAEVERLGARIGAMDQSRGAGPEPLATGEPDFDRARSFSNELMSRFFGLMREMKSGDAPGAAPP